MRRALLAVALGGALLTATACSGGDDSAAAEPAWSTPSAEPAGPAPDYSANTELVCGKVQKIFTDDVKAFGTEMGRMIARKEAKAAADAEKAEKAAGQRLKDIGAKVRKETAAAQDPELKTAGATSAAKFTRSATDAKFFDGIKTTKDLDRAIQSKLTDWMSPVSGYCA
jgi:hypothetical protein